MGRSRGWFSTFLVAGLWAALAAPSGRAADDLTLEEKARIQGYVVLLEDDDDSVRRQAEEELARIGEKARPALETARAGAKPESRRRIDALLTRLANASRTSSAEEWPGLRGGPQRSGVVGGAIPRTAPTLVWRQDVPDENPLQGALVATSDVVVTLSANGTVRCFGAEDGSRRWLAMLDGGITASAALACGRLVVPTSAGVVALDVLDGHEVWKVPAAYGCRAAPAVVGSRVYVSLRNQGVMGLDIRTGEPRVERKLAPMGALLADNDLLVVGTEDGTFRSLDPDSGKDRWKLDLGGAPVMGPTLAAPGVIVVMARDREIQALRVSDGKVAWHVRAGSLSPSESLSAAAGRIFLTDTAGFLRSYDAATGRELWNRSEGFIEMGAPAATSDAVCFGSRGRLGCRDAATGDFLWRIDVERRECSSPIVAAGRLFVLDAGQLRCLK